MPDTGLLAGPGGWPVSTSVPPYVVGVGLVGQDVPSHRNRLESEAKGTDQARKQDRRLEGLLAQKATERSRVVRLYRRGRLTDAELDAQMDEIGKEETALEAQIAELGGRIASADSIAGNIGSAQALSWRISENGSTSRSRGSRSAG